MYNQDTKNIILLKSIEEIVTLLDNTKNDIINSFNMNKYQLNRDINFTLAWINSIFIHYMEKIITNYNRVKNNIDDEKNFLENKNKTKIESKQKNNDNLTRPKSAISNLMPELDKLDTFTSKDIQDKNNDIMRDFMQYSANFLKDDDIKENQTLGIRLFFISNISRNSYNDSNMILSNIYKEFEKENGKDIIIYSNEQFRKNFSNWVKIPKNWQLVKQYIDNYANNFNPNFSEDNKNIKKYYKNLYKDLLYLYFLCELSFPPVEINFNKEDEYFNSKKMIDNFQIGKRNKSKVNFVYFPSLYSNGNYLENGKQWVFNYIMSDKKSTFFIDDSQLLKMMPLVDEKNKFKIPKVSDKLIIELKQELVCSPKSNLNISENANKEYVIHIINTKTKKTYTTKSKASFKLQENEEIFKIEFYLSGEYVLAMDYNNNLK